jgi:hypothetical protein
MKGMNDLIVLFDLEATIIQHWTDRTLINVRPIRNFVQECIDAIEPDAVCIFGVYSYAIWCEENRNILKNDILPGIERAMGEIIFDDDYIFSMDEIVKDYSRKNSDIDYNTYCKFINKEKSLLDFQYDNIKFKHACDITLIDDTVHHNLTVIIPANSPQESRRMISYVNPSFL